MKITEYETYQEKKIHAPSSFPCVTSRCSIPVDRLKVPLHWHDEMELVCVKKGSGIVTVDFITYEAGAGDIMVILPGQLHSIEQQKDIPMEYETISFQLDMLFPRQEDRCVKEYFLPLLQRQLEIPSYLHKDWESYQSAAACLDRADLLCQNRPPAYELSVKSQLYQFFYILFSQCASCGQPASSAKKRSLDKAKLIFQYIEIHYAEKLTIKEMAEACGFSQSHFMKFFKSYFGAPFVAYLKEYRLAKASRLLVSSSSPVLTIAQETGFDNLSYFNRSFKDKYGVTPRQFRQGT